MARNLIPSDAVIRAIKPDDPRKRLADGDGLVLLLFAKRGSHSWRLDYRFQSKRNTLTLGSYPDTSLALARSKADAARKLLAEGFDPSQQRKAERETVIQAARGRGAPGTGAARTRHLRGRGPRVVRGAARRLVQELRRQGDCSVGVGRVPVDRPRAGGRHQRAAAAGGDASDRGARRRRDGAPGVAGLRAGVPLRGGHRPCEVQPGARAEGCAAPAQPAPLPGHRRSEAPGRAAARDATTTPRRRWCARR